MFNKTVKISNVKLALVFRIFHKTYAGEKEDESNNTGDGKCCVSGTFIY